MASILEVEDGEGHGIVVPPPNFSMVEDSIFRSSFPRPSHFPFLSTLNLRSVICLCPEPYPQENLEFLRSQNIQLFQLEIEGKTDLSASALKDVIMEALRVLIDVRNHPVLIHCNRGKHRTGCVVGCLRKLQNWCLDSVFEEYQRFAGSKSRITDLGFIGMFDIVCLKQCLYSIIFQHQGYGSKKRRLLYKEEDVRMSQSTSV